MADDDFPYVPSNTINNFWVHEPLPYIITVRSTVSDDAAPVEQDYPETAYSIFEAILQAVSEAGGTGLDDVKHKAVRIRPDTLHFKALLMSTMANAFLDSKK